MPTPQAPTHTHPSFEILHTCKGALIDPSRDGGASTVFGKQRKTEQVSIGIMYI